MAKQTWYTIKKCMKILEEAEITTSRITFMKWVKEYGFGEQLSGKGSNWIINPYKFKNFLKTKFFKTNEKKKREKREKGKS